MLTNYFICYKLNKTPTPFQEEKNTSKLNDCHFFYVIRVLGIKTLVFINFKKEKKLYFLIFYTCIPEIDSAYHTGSAFTQHYCVSRVQYVLNISGPYAENFRGGSFDTGGVWRPLKAPRSPWIFGENPAIFREALLSITNF